MSSALLVGGLYWLWQRALNKAMTANVTTNDKGAGKNSELSKVFAAQEFFTKIHALSGSHGLRAQPALFSA